MSTQPKPLKVYFFSIEGIGHMMACVGLAQALSGRGHSISFLLNEGHKGQFAKFGYEEILLKKKPKEDEVKPENPIKEMSKMLINSGFLGPASPLEKMKTQLKSGLNIFKDLFEPLVEFNVQISKAIEEGKPDLIIVDSFVIPPAIFKAPVPWIFLCSAQPLCVFQSKGKLPPYGAGFPTDSKPSDWAEYMPLWREYRYKVFGGKAQEEINALFDYTPPYQLSDGDALFVNSPFLNIYGYPEELDYADIFPIPENFARVDAFMRQTPDKYELPPQVQEMPGEKLIYLSLGSMGSVDIVLMQRITSILAKNEKYRVIVSKGPRADEYELPSNCWGEGFLPQTSILPLVDMVITHGGNNTVTESFSFGKPMIVLPLFGDQFDNAQRVYEKGFGVRLEPYTFTETELFEAMDKLLNDKQLQQQLRTAAERMANSKSKEIVCQKVETIATQKH